MFPKVNPKQSFPKLEEEVIKYWNENDTFKKSIETRRESEEFNFYDGPPFATWTPHYGHILAGTIKDVIPRYQTMLGKRVDRVFGWDCHGLPIENIVEKKMWISGRDDIENKIGVFEFNEECRANVFGYVDEWKKTVERMGRWVDMDHDYKTMDAPFMESVWWVFKSIYDKWLIYEGNRVVPYCPRCTTPLSNFEVNQGYKDKQSKTVTVKFKVDNWKQEVCYRDSTWIVVKNTKWQILLWKKKSNWLLSFPWWKTENCETPLNCIKRELLEETWLEMNEEKLYSCNTSFSNWHNWKEHVFEMLLEDESLVKNPEEDKYEHWKFYDVNNELLVEENFEVHSYNVFKQVKWDKLTQCYHTTWNKYILAWTTTPWTLYANLGLAVWADIDYVELLDKTNWDTYILAREKVKDYYKKEEDYQILREYKWECLVWIKYEPIFSDFDIQLNEMNADLGTNIKLGNNAWTVRIGHHVTTDTWTWIVHIAPAYWEDDFIIWEKEDLWFVAHIDNSGKTYNLLDNNGKFVFDFNEDVIAELKEKKLSLHIGTIVHSYPHCWRCDTPLIYRGISAWYVAVEKIRDKMVANNLKSNWTPDAIKHGRFGKWLEQARDWNISRNRYWGSALPIWQSEDKKEEVCIGSIEELYEWNKEFRQVEKKDNKYYYTVTWKEVDLHKHFVDQIFVKNEKWIKAKKVLGIHGFLRNKDIIDFFEWTKSNLEKEWIVFDSPIFEEWSIIDYKNWEKKLDVIGVENYDTVLTHSMWGRVALEYIIEHKIKLDRLVLVAPWIEWSWTKEVAEFYSVMKQKVEEINKYVKEIIVLISKDDKKVRSEQWQRLAKITWANLIEVNWYGHFNITECKLIEWIVKYWAPLKRIPEVLDCWFESGSMPYASKHYPFENKDNFKFPADFIAEWLDQTRGWFYTLIILSTALYDSPATMNTIVNGIVLAEDGKKMSKSLKNYPDPNKIFDNYWADAMRYYLMNSPVVEAQDLRFSEAWVEEVVKKTILPLWNTYSFFTTYANIDKYKPSKSHIYYCRHGETENNVKKIMNGWDVDTVLNSRGESQAVLAWKNFKISWEKIDIIISSPKIRAKKTAELIAKEIWYDLEIIEDARLIEHRDWEFKWMTHNEIIKYAKKEYNLDLELGASVKRFFKDGKYNKVEDVVDFDKRVLECYKEIEEKYKWKNVLIVAHSGTFRPINRYINDIDLDNAHYVLPTISNGTIYKLPAKRDNILDKWIISELNKLIWDVKTGFDNYRINEATRPIMSFMDNLTNWYIRRSRKRFWGTGLDEDKLQAYETLYEVLVELCKVFAPLMPFVSEHIFRNLTSKESVHLEIFPNLNQWFILDNLNSSFDKTAKLVNLWLACREKNKLRVRQPLKTIKISEQLDKYYLDIIKDELNVKEISVFTENEMPKRICKPNARLIWPRFWNDVKFILNEAKSGNFEELEWGRVKVWDFILEIGEYEIEFQTSVRELRWFNDIDEAFESWYGCVVALNITLTPELIAEWFARDLVRHVQESRKEADFEVDDRILLEIWIENSELKNSVEKFKENIESETLSTIVDVLDNPSYEKEIELEEYKIKLALKKI